MKSLGALPVLKVAGVMAVAVAFAAAIAAGASRDNGPRDFAQQSTIPTRGPTRIPEVRTPGLGTPFLTVPTVVPPVVTPRAVIPGADKGGLFGDGVVNLPKVDTTGWKTYSNTKYGYSLKYPPDWRLQETDSSGFVGPQGQPSYPLQAVRLNNPATEQGRNIMGTNCQWDECNLPPPNYLGFFVSILPTACNIPGDLIASDTLPLLGKQASRCVIKSPRESVSSIVSLAFPSIDGKNLLVVSLQRGRSTTVLQHAILETMLSTLTLN